MFCEQLKQGWDRYCQWQITNINTLVNLLHQFLQAPNTNMFMLNASTNTIHLNIYTSLFSKIPEIYVIIVNIKISNTYFTLFR